MVKSIVTKAVATACIMTGLSISSMTALAQSVTEQEDVYLIKAYREKRAQCAAVEGKAMMQCYADLAVMQPKYKSAKARVKLHTVDTGRYKSSDYISG